MKNELTFERQHRTAPRDHFSGGYVGHHNLESDLPALRPVRELVGGAFVIALVCAFLFLAALVTP